ncbi:MAG: DUF2911 domain-containing protein [Acidobacteriota bacterium]
MRSAPVKVSCGLLLLAATAAAQQRPASPQGRSAVEVAGTYDVQYGYENGRWIEVRYGRPILRGRDIFGPDDWQEALNDGAEVWRAGANYSTVLSTEVALDIDGVSVEPGEYTVFIDLGDDWTFILSRWPAQTTYDYENKDALFGAYYYTADRDVVRTTMAVEDGDISFEQLSWQFVDVDDEGGRLMMLWGTKRASVAFQF